MHEKRLLHYDKAGITEVDIDNCTDYNQLMEWKLMIDDDLAGVKQQLDDAKQDAYAHKQYADPDWFKRASGVKGILGRLSQRIGIRLSMAKKATSRPGDDGTVFLQAFKDQCKRVLPPDVYEQILELAKRSFAENESNGNR